MKLSGLSSWKVVVGAAVFTVVAMVAVGALYVSMYSGNAEATDRITLDTYRAVEPGMSYEDVRDLASRRGIPESESANRAVYVWRNPDGSQMRVTFRNGKVERKTQDGLPD